MKLSCSHAVASGASDLCRDVTSREKLWKEAKEFGGKTSSSVGVPSGAGAGSVRNARRSLTFQGSGAPERSARPPTRLHPPPLSLTPMFLLCLFVFG